MKHSQHEDYARVDAIRHDVRRLRYDEFARAADPPGASDVWMMFEQTLDRRDNAQRHVARGFRTVIAYERA